ncbi:polymer-forming cytoskeletal protein [Halieaceae bacterium IMCC14734]|uniref:Polymer-forming cytoskeletal protein n=1 Tax=Candidatus Litorirhabdus singularis TaxID=2518993 RepID=A0ABT3TLW1_9GAMM|nr:polymer-forming cytoskeletal protein [Candidatus Litorirhabdus singularis]MCX2983321.1 polymer-forming cytoskeletal protein [Candidatus Litorirhabdus singularis]
MLGSKDKSGFGNSSTTTLISSESRIDGDITFSGNLDVEGIVRGNVTAVPDRDAVVRVIDQGRVEGEIRAPSVIINGDVVGDVYSSQHLELAAKARVQGNVHYTQVEMAIGAEVNGSLRHGAEDAAAESEAAVQDSYDSESTASD